MDKGGLLYKGPIYRYYFKIFIQMLPYFVYSFTPCLEELPYNYTNLCHSLLMVVNYYIVDYFGGCSNPLLFQTIL